MKNNNEAKNIDKNEKDCSADISPKQSEPCVRLNLDEGKTLLNVISKSMKSGAFDGPDLPVLAYMWKRISEQVS